MSCYTGNFMCGFTSLQKSKEMYVLLSLTLVKKYALFRNNH